MNTCQTNIKTSILLMYLDPHHGQKVRVTTMVPSELNKRRKIKQTNTGLLNTYHIINLRKLS